jgi:uncharacterized protein
MKKVLIVSFLSLGVHFMHAQTLEKMLWFNEPQKWKIENNSLTMSVTPQSYYWSI